jgi:pimeloyl-ACP methyl ester carboxylesterase
LQLGAVVEPLVSRGYRVVAYDAPGHGLAPGNTSSMLHFAASLGSVSRRFGPIHGLIAHSLGGTAAIYALGNLELTVDRIVTIAPSARLSEITERFGELTGFHTDVIERMKTRFEQKMGFDWKVSEPLHLAPEMSARLMVIHDKDDRFVPYQEGVELAAAWPGSRLMTTYGLGHHRILRDRNVVGAAVDFVAAMSMVRDSDRTRRDEEMLRAPMI